MLRILVIDDEPTILSLLATVLKAEGFQVTPVHNSEKARDLIHGDTFDLMVADIHMPPPDGMELLRLARKIRPGMSVIMLTAYGSVETAIEAMKLGAFDYLTKPFKVDELVATIHRALEYTRALSENVGLKAQFEARYDLENIVAVSRSMQEICKIVRRVGPSDATVLVYGQSGTGKELIAKAIHTVSRRRGKQFLPINCAALPEPLLESEMFGHVKGAFTGASADKKGLFEAADGGTIFLDEIGAIPPSIQSKLLRVLQEKEVRRVGSNEHVPVDARVVAATNTRLEDLIEHGAFREDLYYRISVIPIEIEPLSRRPEDIMPLFHHFLRQELGSDRSLPEVDPEVTAILREYTWPGNVRELENAVKHAVTFAREDRITPDVLPPRLLQHRPVAGAAGAPLPSALEEIGEMSLKDFLRAREREYVEQVLSLTGGDKVQAARTLRISLASLYRKLPKHARETEP